MDFPISLAGLKSVNPGQFCIPTGPGNGTSVAKSTTANVYGAYVELIASTSAALYIVGVVVNTNVANADTLAYVQWRVGVGAAAAEVTVAEFQQFYYQAGFLGSQYYPLAIPIPVAASARIAAKCAADTTNVCSPKIMLVCINQSNVVAM